MMEESEAGGDRQGQQATARQPVEKETRSAFSFYKNQQKGAVHIAPRLSAIFVGLKHWGVGMHEGAYWHL